MSSESPQRSLCLANPVNASVVRVLRLLDPIARSAGCEYFIAGATARDLVLVHLHGLHPGRATRDVDFGIAIENWEQFQRLKERLIATGEFTPAHRVQQRLTYQDPTAGSSLPLDFIPFRGIESSDRTFAWPPGLDVVMNVAGFEEAWASSLGVEVEHGLTVRVASIPGLTLLKFAAWADRGQQTNKDATDLYHLLNTYADAGNIDRLYDYEMDLFEAVGFDMQLAGAELLGRDVAAICHPQTFHQIRSILTPPRRERLIINMLPNSLETPRNAEVLLDRFCSGFLPTAATFSTHRP